MLLVVGLVYDGCMSRSDGFTLIEMLVYVGLLGVLLPVVVGMGQLVLSNGVKAETVREVGSELDWVSQRIELELRNARSVTSIGVGEICLEGYEAEFNPVRLYVDSGVLWMGWGGGDLTCGSVSNSAALSGSFVRVESLSFEDVSSGELSVVRYGLDLSRGVNLNRDEWVHGVSYGSSVEVRGR